MIPIRHQCTACVGAVLVAVLLTLAACGGGGSTVSFPGVILMAKPAPQLQEDGTLDGLYEMRGGLKAPAPSSASHRAALAAASGVWAVSPDGQTVVLEPNILKNLASGETYELSTGDPKRANVGPFPSFSADAQHLAYTSHSSGLYVLDVRTKETDLLYEVRCAEYEEIVGPFEHEKTVCTGLGDATWLDPDTFFFKHFSGSMPGMYWSDSEDSPENVNQMTVMTRQGEEILSMDIPEERFANWSMGVPVQSAFAWVDPDELAEGIYDPEPLPDSALGGYLTPDGRYVLLPGEPWRLLEWRTGSVTSLGTRRKPDILSGCIFSPDQTMAACRGTFFPKESLLIVPLSEQEGGVALEWNAQEQWRLLAWTE